MYIFGKKLVFAIFLFVVSCTTLPISGIAAKPIYLYASQSGKTTLDQGEGGGNPFASAFVDLLASDYLSFYDFYQELIELTEQKSKGFQRPEILFQNKQSDWQFLPTLPTEKRIALVLVFSDYKSSGITSLPGAKNDLKRISKALTKAKFEVQTEIDPNKPELNEILRKFASQSEISDVAMIYTTGHGAEVNGEIYLLPSVNSLIYKQSKLFKQAINLKKFGEAVRSKKANLVFYGGCRNNPFETSSQKND